jgi:hypothetical protein
VEAVTQKAMSVYLSFCKPSAEKAMQRGGQSPEMTAACGKVFITVAADWQDWFAKRAFIGGQPFHIEPKAGRRSALELVLPTLSPHAQ